MRLCLVCKCPYYLNESHLFSVDHKPPGLKVIMTAHPQLTAFQFPIVSVPAVSDARKLNASNISEMNLNAVLSKHIAQCAPDVGDGCVCLLVNHTVSSLGNCIELDAIRKCLCKSGSHFQCLGVLTRLQEANLQESWTCGQSLFRYPCN